MEFGLVAVWLVTYLALLAAGQAIAKSLLPQLSDEGAGVGLPIAAGVIWLVVYWVGRVSITAGLWLGVGVVVAAALLAHRRTGPIDRRAFAETAAVFTAAFLFLIAIRAVDPAVHPGGGEKFLDFGLLRSLLRSGVLPPQDVWFAGETVRYYYGGHLLAALFARLTGTAPRYAYNLALAGFYAMVVTAAVGLARNIATAHGHDDRLAGAFAAFFVGLASNLMPAAQLLWLVTPGAITGARVPFFGVTVETIASDLGVPLDGLATGIGSFGYWSASRVIGGTINEFPLFAWLNGDLHAHMMSTPFLLLGATVLFGYYRTPAAQRWRRRALLFVGLPAVGAIVSVTNTWSMPTIAGLAAVTIVLAPADPIELLPDRVRPPQQGWIDRELGRLGVALGSATLIALLSVVIVLPYWLVVSSGSEGMGFLPDRSPIVPLVLVHGAFLVIAGLHYSRYAVGRLGTTTDRIGATDAVIAALALAVAGFLAIRFRVSALLVVAPLVGAGWLLARDGSVRDRPSPGFESVLVVASAGLIVLAEFVFLEENAGGGRYNTVFKLYMQIWVLFATGAGTALAVLIAEQRPGLGLSGPAWRRRFKILAALLVVSTSIYAALAVPAHFGSPTHRTDDPSLDALAFVETDHPDEARAIAWLDRREGQPTLLSRPGRDPYQWRNAPSSLTGIPTVAGWVHETGYHGPDAYYERAGHVDVMFTGGVDRQRELLRQYDVEYVYVGPKEREQYSQITIQRLDAVEPVGQFDAVTIYRVDQGAL
ncbi:DUF2298 domain-containing protein [Halococcoides cellulosivorans]|uniref:Chlor_Arch_YYY domain-containing protein n=1 Tax=Halococcoides cellulosivorans TaxID=1679096 RepID=A0A2R4WXI0_9EURY|nr:DUF2298 domain-containing protein [Halococcoides cellulosivorans]AWB26253.1 hypothetical protein HARCEL1_00210 [Halococcoides cellulosivorans]